MGGNPLLGKTEIAALIPHTGAMSLLDTVRFWDDTTIVCTASSHLDQANPLAAGGRLDTICGIEYAAQAMAVHGGLTAIGGKRPTAGYLASVRDVVRHTSRLDPIPTDLEITATKLGGDPAGALYAFTLRAGPEIVLEGRAAVVLKVRS
jgi:predicted hotdog family 3-hydroxylacyl-ACP dehydratase